MPISRKDAKHAKKNFFACFGFFAPLREIPRSGLVLLLVSVALADPASRLVKEARRAEKRGDDLQAYALLSRAAELRPRDPRYHAQAEGLRVRAAQSLTALGRLQDALALDPGNSYLKSRIEAQEGDDGDEDEEAAAPPSEAEIVEAQQAAEPVELKPRAGSQSFDLRGDGRAIYEQMMRAYGLDVVFDADFTAGPPFRFQIENVSFRQALHALMAVTGTFLVPIHERVALAAKDTQQKRTELEPMMAALLPIPEAISMEEINEVARSVQQVLDIKRLAVDSVRRQVLVRDTVTRVHLAKALYKELARRRSEVLLDIDLVSASRSTMTNLGFNGPANFSAVNRQPGSINIGGGASLFGIQVASSTMEANWVRSEAQLLTSFRLRASDALPATMHIGDKYPIVNALFSPIVATPQIQSLQKSGQLIQPFPSFTFEDLGLVFKVTPRIHDRHEISLTIEAQFRVLTGSSLNGLPIISDRKFSSAVRLKEGETSIIAGLAQIQASRSDSGLGPLIQIPVIGRLLAHNSWQFDQNELLLTITPHLMTLPPAEQAPQHSFYWGSESRPAPPI